MTHLLLTGGSGTLGRALIDQLKTADFTVRVLSRHSRPANLAGDLEWAQADLATGAGLNEALIDVSTIVHAASDSANVQAVDVAGTARLIEAARLAHAAHLIYVSIVGIDRIQYPYYTAKVAAEKIIMENTVPWTIVRATQFHDLIDSRLQAALKTPIAFLPIRYQYQSIAVSEVAAELVEIARQPPIGRAPDIGGPQVLRYGDMARDWLKVQGRSRQIILPKFPRGSYAHAFTYGYNTCPQNRQGRLTWQDWLLRKYR
ncbi:MAG TPA: SDR family oxidoreductase [Anaerolineae bacterium]|nr:SDR family oxidoreductase [Anaerolineae bacterium]